MTELRKKRRLPQLTLSTLLLLITAIGTMMAWYRTRQQLNRARLSTATMESLARQLRIDDPTAIAAITRMPTLSGELIFDVYIPDNGNNETPHQLCLTLEGIIGHGVSDEFPEPEDCVMIGPGTHKIEVRHHDPPSKADGDEHRVEILLNDSVAIHATRPAAWHPSGGWSSSGTVRDSQTFDPEEPVELHRRRFHNPAAGGGSTSAAENQPTNGILLWIDRPGVSNDR